MQEVCHNFIKKNKALQSPYCTRKQPIIWLIGCLQNIDIQSEESEIIPTDQNITVDVPLFFHIK